jgi:hypothetical protein
MKARRTVQRIRAPLFLALSAFAVGGLATAVAHAQGLTLPQMAEPPVSPINPGTLPGSTIGGNATGVNPRPELIRLPVYPAVDWARLP